MARIPIDLPQDKREEALDLAKQRNKKEKRFGGKTYNDTMTAESAHYMGLLAEISVGWYFNVEINKEIYSSHGDNGVDLYISELGGNVAVKSTSYKDKPLLRAEVKRDYDCINTYVLCYVSKDLLDIEIIGYISRNDLHLHGKKKKLGRYLPENWIVGEDYLRCVRAKKSIHKY